MTMHSESTAMRTELDTAEQAFRQDVRNGALTYLDVAGPAGWSELVRVLCSHLDVTNQARVVAALRMLVLDGALSAQGDLVSLPAGSAPRDNEEQR